MNIKKYLEKILRRTLRKNNYGKFIIRLFDQSGNGNKEEVISLENDNELEKWINNNLLAK